MTAEKFDSCCACCTRHAKTSCATDSPFFLQTSDQPASLHSPPSHPQNSACEIRGFWPRVKSQWMKPWFVNEEHLSIDQQEQSTLDTFQSACLMDALAFLQPHPRCVAVVTGGFWDPELRILCQLLGICLAFKILLVLVALVCTGKLTSGGRIMERLQALQR